MPMLEFLTGTEASSECRAAEAMVREQMETIGHRDHRYKEPTWRSLDGRSMMAIRHEDLEKRHLPAELAPFLLLDGTILASGPDAMGPHAIEEITHILYLDGWLPGEDDMSG